MNNKDVLKTSSWQSHISEQEKSSLNITEYCKKSGISKKTFYRWRKRLERDKFPWPRKLVEDMVRLTPLKIIGYETSERLSYEPSKTKVIVYKRAKYGVDSGDYTKTAPPEPSIIPKGIATPELIAYIVEGPDMFLRPERFQMGRK